MISRKDYQLFQEPITQRKNPKKKKRLLWRGDVAFRTMHFSPKVRRTACVVIAGGSLIIRVSPYFWKRSADGARSGPPRYSRDVSCLQSCVVHLESRISRVISRVLQSPYFNDIENFQSFQSQYPLADQPTRS